MMAALDTSWTYTFQGRNARGEIMCKLPQDKLKREVDCETEMENLESGFPAPQDSEDAAYIYRRFTKRSNMKIKKLKEEIKEHGVEKFAQKYLLLSDEDYEQQFNNNVTEIEIEDGKVIFIFQKETHFVKSVVIMVNDPITKS